MKTILIASFAAALLAGGLAGCGEAPQVVQYEQGKYQGKADSRPYEGGRFAGDKAAWENTLRERALSQNEYKRTN